MTVAEREFVDTNPPYLWPDYPATRKRAPRQPLVQLPRSWFHDAPGPSFDRIPLAPADCDLTRQHEGRPIGQRVIVEGRVLDRVGEPVPRALVEIWQANAAGRYVDPADPGFMPLDPNFTGWARFLTDAEGRFRLTTVKPAAYAQERGTIYRPAHLHASIFGHRLSSRVITQCYFQGDPLIDRDPIVQAIPDRRGIERMVSRFDDEQTEAGGYESAMVFQWDVVLRGREPGSPQSPPATLVGTPSQTSGPLYAFGLMFEGSEDAVDPGSPGALRLEGRLLDGDGEPVGYPDGLIEIWQGGQFARTRTDADGRYAATVARPEPASLPGTDAGTQAPHLNLTVFARGLLKQAQTRLYFADEADANRADPVLERIDPERRGTLLAAPEDGRLRFDIRLQGEPGTETAFFDF